MKLAISSSGQDLAAQLDPRFGRCRYFLIIETDSMSCEVFDNDNAALSGGAGIQSAQLIAAKGAKALITGHCGPNAMQALTAAGIQVYVGQSGTVQGVVDKFKNGQHPPPMPTHRRTPVREAKAWDPVRARDAAGAWAAEVWGVKVLVGAARDRAL